MKIPRSFIVFLSLAQAVICLGHWALYKSLLFFFPFFLPHQTGLAIILTFLSVSFLSLSLMDFRSENSFIRASYIISALWLPLWFYLLMSSLLSVAAYFTIPETHSLIIAGLFLAAILLSVYGSLNARVHRVVNIKVGLPNLPDYWQGKTAVVVSDLHLGHVLKKGFARNVVRQINVLKPDLVLIPGDFFDSVKTSFTELAAPFEQIKSTHGTYFVTGNHEQYVDYQACVRAVSQAGINVLENQKVEIEGLQIAGLAYFPESKETSAGIEKILGSLNLDRQKPSILLKHVPNLPEASEPFGVHLQLSGHTHLGQIWPGRYITRKIYKGFDYGLKQLGKMYVYTSSGVGTWGPPVRIFTKSEIVKITLVKL